jgi:hypothetical protein
MFTDNFLFLITKLVYMKTNKINIITFCLILLSIAINAQEKYALLICGDIPYTAPPPNKSWHLANPNPQEDAFDEFWNDIYLFWEMLIEQGYENDNIFVLFGNGNEVKDWPQHPDVDIADRYNPQVWHDEIIQPPNGHITDFHANLSDLVNVLEGFAIGNQALGIPQLTEDDFLFIWAFGHGNNQFPIGHNSLILMNGLISDEDFADHVNAINCDKKVLLFQQCFSGSFVPYYSNEYNVYALSAANSTMSAYGLDDNYYDDIDFPNDSQPGNKYSAYEMDVWLTPEGVDWHHDHGEFNLHMLNALRGIAPSENQYYSVSGLQNFSLSGADVNNDNIVSMSEAFQWNWQFNSAFVHAINGYDDPQEHDPLIGYKTSLKYPNLININGDASGSQNGIIGICKQVHVLSGSTLTLNNAIVNLDYEGELIVDAGGTLVMGDNVKVNSIIGTRKIIINGNLTIGSNVSFLADEGTEIRLEINNTSLTSTINSATFQRGILQSNQNSLTLNNCNFNGAGGVVFSRGNLNVSGCHFSQATLRATNASSSLRQVTIDNHSTFSNSNVYGVYISNYPNFSIQHNSFTSHATGIGLFQCGSGRTHILSDNLIEANGIGLTIYNTTADLNSNNLTCNGNIIRNNYVGIQCLDRSRVSLVGYSPATLWNETQQIKDNAHYEIYATQGSFPCPFSANAIIDNDNGGNPNDPLIYYSTLIEESLDVRRNYWGTNFNYLQDLYPPGLYLWEPVWQLNGIGGGTGAGELYSSAETKIEEENYTGAKTDLLQLVSTYPSSIYAEAALKVLYPLEELTGNNYMSLQEYYRTNTAILGDSSLVKLADFLANFCDIKLENWPTAIAWFEDVIQQPETFEDSIFAIIDLGYTYWLMENSGLKSSYTGAMPQYKFGSQKDYEENRDYLLSLLPGDGLSEAMKQSLSALKTGELLQNVPNPFKGTTEIWFKLTEESIATLTIYDYTGKEVSVINAGSLKSGNHSVEFNSANLPSGIYFYSLEVNGIKTDTKKMTLIR